MADITLDGLPAKTGTIDDAAVLHMKETGVDKKVTIAALLAKIAAVYPPFINSLLATISAFDARDVLLIDRRTTVTNADYTALNTDKVVSQIGTMSAPRTFTLPAANTFRAGGELIIIDESGSVTSVNKIIVLRAGADIIDGATSIDIGTPYGSLRLISDGTDSWKIANAIVATETVAGIGEIANTAETVAGIDNTRFLTPFGLKTLFNSSILNATQSSIRIPINIGSFSEIIIKFGTASIATGAGTTIVFANPFPNSILLAGVFSRSDVSNTNSQRLYSQNETLASVLFRNPRTTGNGYWFAIGN